MLKRNSSQESGIQHKHTWLSSRDYHFPDVRSIICSFPEESYGHIFTRWMICAILSMSWDSSEYSYTLYTSK